MISTIYEEIRTNLLELKLNESKDHFDIDTIPNSILDNSFYINPCVIEQDPNAGAKADGPFNGQILNMQSTTKINFIREFTANNNFDVIKKAGAQIEDIIKKIISITVGSNFKNQIEYVGSTPTIIENKYLIYEIDFLISYRLENF